MLETVFNLSDSVLSNEIKLLEKDLSFAPVQRKINEPELLKDFDEFYRKREPIVILGMSLHKTLVLVAAFTGKSSWKPLLGLPNLEVF